MFHNSTAPVLPSISSASPVSNLPVCQDATTYTYHGTVISFVTLPVFQHNTTYTYHSIAIFLCTSPVCQHATRYIYRGIHISFVHLTNMPAYYNTHLPRCNCLLCAPYRVWYLYQFCTHYVRSQRDRNAVESLHESHAE